MMISASISMEMIENKKVHILSVVKYSVEKSKLVPDTQIGMKDENKLQTFFAVRVCV